MLTILFFVSVATEPLPSCTQSRSGGKNIPPSLEKKHPIDNKERMISLDQHKPVEQDISAKEAFSYEIPLARGQFLQLTVACWGINIKSTVYKPGDQPYKESICFQRGRAPISIIADSSGIYRIKLNAMEMGTISGHYKLTIEHRRRATSQDQRRLLAEQAFEKAEQLRSERTSATSLQAISQYEWARNQWLAVGDYQEALFALISIGKTHQSTSNFEQAFLVFQQALTLSKAQHLQYAEETVLNHIGYLHAYTGDNQKAVAHATLAIKLSRALHDRSGEAQALHTLGDAYYGFGELSKTLQHYRGAQEIWKQLKDFRGQADVLISYGYSFLGTSDIRAAEDSFNQALTISRAIRDRHMEAIALRALGNLQTKFGESQQAFNLLLQALNILNMLEDPYLKATVLGGLAYSYKNAGEKHRALDYYKQAMAIFQAINDRWGVAESEMTIGEIYYVLGEKEQAIIHYTQALSSFRSLKMIRWQAITLRNIGLVYDSLHNETQALVNYERSLALTRAGQDHRYAAYTFSYIGHIHERSGDHLKAMSHFQRALQLSRKAVDPAGESLMLSNLAHLERDRGNLDKARAHIEDAIRIAESLRTKLASQDLRASYFASARQYYDLYIDILMRLHEQRPNEGFDIAAFEASERARARSLLESLREARANIRQGVDPGLLKQERELQQLLNAKAERHGRLLAGNQSAEAEAIAREITQLSAQYDQVKDKIKLTSPRYAALTQPQPLGLREIQQRVLDQDSVLLEYALGEDRSYLWAITKTEVASFTLPKRVEIETTVRRLYSLITSRQKAPEETLAQYQARIARADSEQQIESRNLSEMVLDAAASKLARKRLLIVADGALQYIPFQALVLPSGSGGEPMPLIFNHEIVNEPSASALALLLDETANREPAPKA
ncbi:MAG: tetratricopeptide repeat protein, partial [Blastocatellia bacterium]